MSLPMPDPMKFEVSCHFMVEVHPILQHVTAHLQNDLPYEIKIIPHKDRASSARSAPSAGNAIEVHAIFDSIKKGEFTRFDFYQMLLSYQNKINLCDIHSEEGFNLLHAIIVYDKLYLMLPLVHLKLFTSYFHETIPISSSSSFGGHTPLQITESKTHRFKNALVKHERLVHSMGKFLKACHDADIALVRRMIQSQGQLLQEKDSFKNNCLYWALVSNNLELFTLLLDSGADYNNVNDNKENLLYVACLLGHHKFISVLMTRCQLDVTAVCSDTTTPLERVAYTGDINCLKELLNLKVCLTACVLPYAAYNGKLPFIK